ncbi:DUF6414 family protein [Lysinibacillus capsici]|uniref:DUF6414 family protein n=1 Tax=Lysinibacillus capsici TaxID=2115968 RepID=UPI003CFD94A2
MKKVVYFDESSALDLIDIKNEGRAEKIIDSIVEKAGKFGTEGAYGTGWLDNLTTGLTGKFSAGISRKRSNIVQTNITNTILTSFINVINEPTEKDKEIELSKITTKHIYILEGSAAYMKAIAPFIKILKEDNMILKGNEDINSFDIYNIDETLEDAKGYYELIAIDINNVKTIVRFNLDGFRNNYRLQDLQKMNLTLYGVPVGKTKEESLRFEWEIDSEKKLPISSESFDAYSDLKSEEKVEDTLEIIDIILAGIE